MLSFPPFHLLVPPFVALVPLILLLRSTCSARHAARTAFVAGLVANGLVLHWLPVALWRHTPWAIGYSVLLVGAVSAVWAVVGWGTVLTIRQWQRMPLWLAFAIWWSAADVAVGYLGAWSFPWLGLGHSLTGFPVLVQWADLAGTPGISFWLAAINGALASALITGRVVTRQTVAAIASIVLALTYGLVRTARLTEHSLGTVAMVQPNVRFDAKRSESLDTIVAQVVALTRKQVAPGRADLIVWPETAIPGPLARHPGWAAALTRTAVALEAPILSGALIPGRGGTGNGAVLIPPTGSPRVVYAKRQLVPVTERWLEPGREMPLVDTPLGPASVVICYESIFWRLSRHDRQRGSRLIVLLTNDVWFGGTGGSYQHAAHAVMRAIETRQPVVRAANSGVSLVARPDGKVIAMTGVGVAAGVVVEVVGTTAGSAYVDGGWWLTFVPVIATVLLASGVIIPGSVDRRGVVSP